MKVVALEALTKLIQLVKSAFIKVEDVTTTTEIDTEVISEIDTKLTSEIELATVATTGLYRDLTGIPTIGNATITFTQGGVTKGTITTNQDTDATIALDAGGGSSGITNTADDPTVSLTILGNSTPAMDSINIGYNSTINSWDCSNTVALGVGSYVAGMTSTAIGANSRCEASRGIALGFNAQSSAIGAMQIGQGTNSEDFTLCVGFHTFDSPTPNYKLLDGTTGKIPSARLTDMVGADGTNAGTSGAVPTPGATDNTRFLRGDGTWSTIPATQVILRRL